MVYSKPWMMTQHGGPTTGKAIEPDAAARIINNSKNPAIVVGTGINVLEGQVFDRILKFREKGIPVIATGDSSKYFVEKGIADMPIAGVVEVTNYLTDPEWPGFDGSGLPDLAMVVGVHLDLTNQTFQTLKNYTDIKSMSISRYNMANATYSFPNLDNDLWLEFLDELLDKVEKR